MVAMPLESISSSSLKVLDCLLNFIHSTFDIHSGAAHLCHSKSINLTAVNTASSTRYAVEGSFNFTLATPACLFRGICISSYSDLRASSPFPNNRLHH